MFDGFATATVSVPPRCAVTPDACTATYARRASTATPCGSSPTAAFFTTVLLRVSISDTVPESAFATQTVPPPGATATPLGPSPTGTVPTTRFDAGSIRETVAS